MVVRMLKELPKNFNSVTRTSKSKNNQPERKNTISEMKTTLDRINSRSDAVEDQISDMESRQWKTIRAAKGNTL